MAAKKLCDGEHSGDESVNGVTPDRRFTGSAADPVPRRQRNANSARASEVQTTSKTAAPPATDRHPERRPARMRNNLRADGKVERRQRSQLRRRRKRFARRVEPAAHRRRHQLVGRVRGRPAHAHTGRQDQRIAAQRNP